MVPSVPFPDNLSRRLSRGLDLDDAVNSESSAVRRLRLATGSDGLLQGLTFPDDHQQVAVGQLRHVVMGKLLGVDEGEVPHQLTIPGELLDPAAGSWTAEGPFVHVDGASAKEVPV